MALTLNNFVGFETGGLEEASSTTGSSSIVSSEVRTGSYALSIFAVDTYNISPFESVSDAGDDQIAGFAFKQTAVPSISDEDFFKALDSTGACLTLRREVTTGDLILVNAAGTEIDTITNPFTDDIWYYIEIIWQHLDSGTATVFIDGASSGLSATSDFDAGGTFNRYRFSLGSLTTQFKVDDFYCMSGATDTGDFLGPNTEVLGTFQNNLNTGIGADFGNALNQGTWDVAGHTPFVDEAAGSQAGYTSTSAVEGGIHTDSGNIREGPLALVTGTVKGAKGIWRLRRGSGSGTVHKTILGRSPGIGASKQTTRTLNSGLGNFSDITVDASQVPDDSDEYYDIGFGKETGGREIYCSEMAGFLLHVQPSLSTTLADLNFPDQNYYLGPFSV